MDPAQKAERLITRWHLWLPDEGWNEKTIRKAVMNKEDILVIGGEVPVSRRAFTALLDHYHIKRIALFGSAARGELTPTSDIDLLVEFEKGKSPSLGGMVVISDAFSELFDGRKVDIATPVILNNPYRRSEIAKDMEWVYAAF